jgi:glycosyltransferase involved in cell wall biosynthesis
MNGAGPRQLRVGFLLPAAFSVGNPANGILEQARRQAAGLRQRGHEVVELNPWCWREPASLDVLHFFLGGPELHGIESVLASHGPGVLAFSPIIDSNQSFAAYRVAAALGSLSRRLLTVPGILRRQARASSVVICRSRHEAGRVARGLGVPAAKIAIVLNGTTAPATPVQDAEALRSALDLPGEFALHVGAYTQERKNVLRLAEAAQRLGYPLVIAGHASPGPVLDALQRRAAGNGSLRLLGFVDEATKAALYAGCRVFCLPSLHEGTGLAALEAAACGAGVLITDRGGTHDYFAGHARYVDPTDEGSIEHGLREAWRAGRSEALRQRVLRELTWERSAEALEQAYLKCLGVAP